MLRPRTLTLVSALLGALVILAVIAVPVLRFAYRSPSAHIALETMEALIAFLIAYLALGRYRQTGRTAEATVGYAFIVLGLTNLVLSAGSEIFWQGGSDVFSTWAPLSTRLVAAGALAYAAWSTAPGGDRPTRRRIAFAVGDAVATVAFVGAVVVVFSDAFPVGVQAEVPPDTSEPRFEGHPVVLGAQFLSVFLYAAAALGFQRRAEREPDELVRWFAAGSALSATARFSYVLYPSLYSDYVYVGDILRLASYGLFLLGASREILSYWSGVAETAALRERARVARSLHDGIAQELSFIGAQTRRMLRAEPASTELKMLASAADRAGAETRRAIAALSRTDEPELADELAEVVEEVCSRVGAEVKFEIEPASVSADAREALVRIVREAVTNAVRHGEADTIELQVAPVDGQVRVRVTDDGRGFDPGAEEGSRTGFGLVFMRQRGRAISGEVTIVSRPGEGTCVEVLVPSAPGS